MHLYREAEQLRTLLSKCFMGTYEFLQISPGNLLILVKGLRPCGLQFPCDSEPALPCGPAGAGSLRYPRLWALVGALLLQPGTGPSDCLPHLRLVFLWPWPPRLAPLAPCPLLLPAGCPVQHLSCEHLQQEISWPSVSLCSMCLTTSKAMFLAVWPTLAGSQDTAMLCTDHSAMEPPLSCSKALQCTLTQVRKWWEKAWLDVAEEI